MSKKALLSLLGLVIFSFIYISACENPGSSLEESVAPYLELQAVEGASNATITVNRGEAKGLDSYFAIDLSNIDSDGFVTEGLTEGWCLDWTKPIEQNNDVHAGVKMFNTHGSDNWKSANYLMNIKDALKANDPSLTYREIQVALWSLIEEPTFNIDEVLREGKMPSRMMSNGSPNFSVEKTKGIVNKVRSEVDEFTYKVGTPVIIYPKMSDSQQPPGSVEGETAWAYSPNSGDGSVNLSVSTPFCDNNNFQGSRWGWTNGKFEEGDSGTFNLVAGAAKCDINKGIPVGSFDFTYEEGKLSYTINLSVSNDFKDIHIHAGNDLLPLHNNGNYDTSSNLGHTNKIDLPEDAEGKGSISGEITGLSNEIYIAVHLGG